MTVGGALRLVAVLCLALTFVFATPRRARAAPTDAQRALDLGYEADALFGKGDWSAAYEKFRQADALAHSPVFVVYMARCRRNAGRLIDAAALYTRVTAEPLGPNAPKPFRAAVADASTELEAVRAAIPRLVVRVVGRHANEVELRVDGRVVSPGEALEVDPGPHAILATAPGAEAREAVDLEPGSGETAVELTLTAARAGAPAPETSARGSIVPGVLVLSLAAVGFELGAITGGLAASDASAVKEGCIEGRCLRSDADRLDRANTLATVSTVGFVVGGVSLVTGIVLIAVRPGADEAPEIAIGPTGFSVGGAF